MDKAFIYESKKYRVLEQIDGGYLCYDCESGSVDYIPEYILNKY